MIRLGTRSPIILFDLLQCLHNFGVKVLVWLVDGVEQSKQWPKLLVLLDMAHEVILKVFQLSTVSSLVEKAQRKYENALTERLIGPLCSGGRMGSRTGVGASLLMMC